MLGDKKKTPVIGIVERKTGKGRVIAKPSQRVNAETSTGMVEEYVLPNSTVFTDEFSSLRHVDKATAIRITASITLQRCMSWETLIPTRLRDSGL